MSPEPAVLRAVRRAAKKRGQAREEFNQAVLKAVEAGFSSRQVAEVGEVSYMTVQRISRGEA